MHFNNINIAVIYRSIAQCHFLNKSFFFFCNLFKAPCLLLHWVSKLLLTCFVLLAWQPTQFSYVLMQHLSDAPRLVVWTDHHNSSTLKQLSCQSQQEQTCTQIIENWEPSMLDYTLPLPIFSTEEKTISQACNQQTVYMTKAMEILQRRIACL